MPTYQNTMEVDAPVEAVFRSLRDIRCFEEALPFVFEAEEDPDGTEQVQMNVAGFPMSIEAEIVREEENRFLERRSISGINFHETVQLHDRGDGTTGVDFTVEFEPPGWLPEGIAGVFTQKARKQMDHAMEEMKTTLEEKGR